MFNNKKLLKTNLTVSFILIIGFLLTAAFSYQANYNASLDNIEQVSSLTTDGIYYQLTTIFTRPVNISLTMAHDSFLKEHLQEEASHLEDKAYIETIQEYLSGYQEKYGFDSVFLASASGRYYNFNGFDRVLTRENEENNWYYEMMENDKEYSLVVDNDEVNGANNEITVFVNCKIQDAEGKVLGIVGVGIRINYLKELIESYEEKYDIEANLISEDGIIQISNKYSGFEKVDWFGQYRREEMRDKILGWEEEAFNLELWTSKEQSSEKSYIVTRYIPELSWHLVVERNNAKLMREIQERLYQSVLLILGVILLVLAVVTSVIRNFNGQITKLIAEKQKNFQEATEQLYDNIYELNITKNCYVGKRTEQYFESLGAKGLPYDQGLRVIAEKQIKEEFREGYVNIFSPENVTAEFKKGNNYLQYDFMLNQDGGDYHWIHIDAYVFYAKQDDSLHMFTYRKNIDAEKENELKAEMDEMTGFYTKKATERLIDKKLQEQPEDIFGFFIFDIDNFKEANDQFGHAFGDFCIQEFTQTVRQNFPSGTLLGRVGGDEFVAFLSIQDRQWAARKAQELVEKLDRTCMQENCQWHMAASIGVDFISGAGLGFAAVYKNADAALYQVKNKGKNGYAVYKAEPKKAE